MLALVDEEVCIKVQEDAAGYEPCLELLMSVSAAIGRQTQTKIGVYEL